MTIERLKKLDEIVRQLKEFKKKTEDILKDVESIQMEEENDYDSFPESLYKSVEYSRLEDNLDNLDEVYKAVDKFSDYLEDAIYYIEQL